MHNYILADCHSNAKTKTMANLSNTANLKHADTYEEHAESLKPRSKERLYPSMDDFKFGSRRRPSDASTMSLRSLCSLKPPPPSSVHVADTCSSSGDEVTKIIANTDFLGDSSHSYYEDIDTSCHDVSLAPPSDLIMSSPRVKRCSVSSIQTLPSDCSAEDLTAIQVALYSDDEEAEERSMALVEQLLREELGLPNHQSAASTCEDSSSGQPQEQQGGASRRASSTRGPKTVQEITQDLIYQICLQLDEVNPDVKSENWKMLAPLEIEKLELFCYDVNNTAAMGCEDTNCLVCQQEYQNEESLRKLRCGHCFHQQCVDPWILKHDFCPVCRKAIDEE
ncbi:protein ligase RNF126 [Seminavis robusta]|uniref:Protein ligase RNF126 n=1 Tax=Seminavis robusta TaxID=568900 RepID=A0A9N8HXT9_9STRA|nr:protein ligase RNF126 [Seminavis robusta]|eukprot:Sro2616_g332740.1 protein ligase RNF126 (337) ;mRNA; f:9312-10322